MVQHCVAYGCTNEYNPRKKISFHIFPFKRPEILERWITAIRRDKWYPSKSSRLCEEHFLESDYQIKPGCVNKLLKLDAVPSVFSFTKHLVKKVIPPRTLIQDTVERPNESDAEAMDVVMDNRPSTSTPAQQFADAETQTPTDNSIYLLRRKVKTIRQKIRRRDIQISKLKEVIAAISKSGRSKKATNLNAVLRNYFKGKKITTRKISSTNLNENQDLKAVMATFKPNCNADGSRHAP